MTIYLFLQYTRLGYGHWTCVKKNKEDSDNIPFKIKAKLLITDNKKINCHKCEFQRLNWNAKI